MTDKEIALELTKAYMEHLNHRVQGGAAHIQGSHMSTEGLAKAYTYLLATISGTGHSSESE